MTHAPKQSHKVGKPGATGSPPTVLPAAARDLDALKGALVNRTSAATGLAVLARAVANDLGYKAYVRWLDYEIAGFSEGLLGEMLAVEDGNDLPSRVTSYREQRGTVTIATPSTTMEPLPYRFFFSHPLAELEDRSAEALTTRSNVVATIPTSHIPQQGIREWLERFHIERMPIVFNYTVYSRILAGFRSEVAKLVPEFEAIIRFNETFATVSGEEPSVKVEINAPVGNVNVGGSQENISVTQTIGSSIAEIERAFSGLLAPFTANERALLDVVKRFLEEALVNRKSEEEARAVAATVTATVQDPTLVTKLKNFAQALPFKLVEHAALGAILQHATVIGAEILKRLA